VVVDIKLSDTNFDIFVLPLYKTTIPTNISQLESMNKEAKVYIKQNKAVCDSFKFHLLGLNIIIHSTYNQYKTSKLSLFSTSIITDNNTVVADNNKNKSAIPLNLVTSISNNNNNNNNIDDITNLSPTVTLVTNKESNYSNYTTTSNNADNTSDLASSILHESDKIEKLCHKGRQCKESTNGWVYYLPNDIKKHTNIETNNFFCSTCTIKLKRNEEALATGKRIRTTRTVIS
jgi:hypothetical protein